MLDVYVLNTLVGHLAQEGSEFVFQYLPDIAPELLVSLTMPVRLQSYVSKRGLHPIFQMNLPEGYRKERLIQRLGSQADVTDIGLLALTGMHGIGRMRIVPHGVPLSSANSALDMATLLASEGARELLFSHIERGLTDGVSGVMPKALQQKQKATAWSDDCILKAGPDDLPGLAINEFLCLEVARRAGLCVPPTWLSSDGEVLAIGRFDIDETGTPLGVEDFCSLEGEAPVNKYKGTVERIARTLSEYVSSEQRVFASNQLFTLLVLNYALRNADAHLKNFALVYNSLEDVRLAPGYDIVTVTAYDEYAKDIPGLTLSGKRVWAAGKHLQQLGIAKLQLSPSAMTAIRDKVLDAIQSVVPMLLEFTETYPQFRETGKAMLLQWQQGVRDIQPNAKATDPLPYALYAESGLSDRKPAPRKKNPYENPDGAMSHKAR